MVEQAARIVAQIDDVAFDLVGAELVVDLVDRVLQAVEKMRGPVNTKIKLKIIRKGQDNPIDVTLVRDNIRVRSVPAMARCG